MNNVEFTADHKDIEETLRIERSVEFQESDVLTEKDGKADWPQNRNIPPPVEVVLHDCVSAILLSEFLGVAVAVNNQQTGQNLSCEHDNFGFILAYEI